LAVVKEKIAAAQEAGDIARPILGLLHSQKNADFDWMNFVREEGHFHEH
jgi:hypothetical protein